MQSAHNSNPLRKTLPEDPFHRWEDCAITGEVTAKSHSRPGASAASHTLSCLSTLCRGPSFLVWEASVEYRQELSLSKVLGYGDELFSFFCLCYLQSAMCLLCKIIFYSFHCPRCIIYKIFPEIVLNSIKLNICLCSGKVMRSSAFSIQLSFSFTLKSSAFRILSFHSL